MNPRINPTRGMALFLVLIAIVVATLLGATFLAQSENSANIGKRSDERLQARLIAEAGLTMAVKYVSQEPNWRTLQTSGQWINNQPLNNGAFSVWGQDGTGIDANGNVIGGDGSLSDNGSDSVILTSIGTYKNARYRVRSVIGPGTGSTIAVSDYIILKSNSSIDSFDHTLGAPGISNTGEMASASSNSTSAKNILVSFGGHATGTLFLPAGGSSARAVKIISPWPLIDFVMDLLGLSWGIPISDIFSGGAANLPNDGFPLASVSVPAHSPSATDVKYTGNDAPTLSGDIFCKDFSLQGNAVLTVTGPSRIICDGDFILKNNAAIVLENPKFGNTTAFSSSNTGVANKQVAMPITLAKTVQVKTLGAYVSRNNARIRMALYTNAGGAPGSLIVQSPVATLSSNSLSWLEVAVPDATLVPGNYWIALSFEDNNAGYGYSAGGTAKVRNYAAISNGFLGNWGSSDATLAQNINMYLSGNVAGMGGSLEIYVAGNWDFSPRFFLNQETGQCDRMVLYPLNTSSGAKFSLSNLSAYATIVAPNSTLELNSDVDLYGKIRVGNFIMNSNAAFHVDTSEGLARPGAIVDQYIILNDYFSINAISGNAILACNSVGTPVIWLQNNTAIKGNAFGGPGGNNDVQVASHATVTGTIGTLSSPVSIAMPSTPTLSGGSSVAYNTTQTLTSSYKCSSLTFANGADITVDGDRSIVCTGNVAFQGNSKLHFNSGAKLTIYCQGTLLLKDTTQLNAAGDPSKLTINAYDSSNVVFQNSAQMTGVLKAANAQVQIIDTAFLAGSCLAKQILLDGSARIHYDKSGSSQMAWVEGQ